MNWINPLSAIPTKWSNTLMQRNCLSVLDHFVGLAFQGLSRPGGGGGGGGGGGEKRDDHYRKNIWEENYIIFDSFNGKLYRFSFFISFLIVLMEY